MWYLLIRISHCLVVNPVYENMPIWSVMWFQVPGVPSLSNSSLKTFLILIILAVTMSRSSVFHSLKYSWLFKMFYAIRAPLRAGDEYFFLTIILHKNKIYFICERTLSAVSLLLVTTCSAPIRSPYKPMFLAKD